MDTKEHWQQALAALYAELGQQLKALWANGNGKPAQGSAESHVEAVPAPEPAENTSPLLPGTPNGLQAVQPGRGCLVEPQDGGWEVVQRKVTTPQLFNCLPLVQRRGLLLPLRQD